MAHPIVTALDFYPAYLEGQDCERWLAAIESGPRALKVAQIKAQPAYGTTSLAFTATARVNAGRWIVDCPFCDSAQHANPADRRFICASCLNAPVDGAYVGVVWPSDSDRAAIEAALAVRPNIATINWEPGETVAALLADNIAHGVQTP